MNKENFIYTVTDGFWKEKINLVIKEVIPYQWRALNDEISGAAKSYCMRNFRLASNTELKRRSGEAVPTFPVDKWEYNEENSRDNAFHGWVFQDSDFYKWIEAVGYSLMQAPNSSLERLADEAIELVCSAQMENGYLDTLYIINNPNKMFTNLKDYHELYCFGHMCEGAISYYNATGKTKLLDAACRFADLICTVFGEGRKCGYPGHEIAEMALIKLYEITKKQEYLDLASFFINERGKKPYYFDLERGVSTDGSEYIYNQAHLEVRQQTKAVGHAVRAVYLYSGMADVARYTNDFELLNACRTLFKNIVECKMYITGAIGSQAVGEAFGDDYYLPNDSAYAESCASIGLVFFAYRMLLQDLDSVYADVIERALYNGIISGISLDGKSFFYVNPLEVNPKKCKLDERLKHVKSQRQKWFGCACCPPNIARLITSLGQYCVSENDSTLYVHQYISGKTESETADVYVQSDFPYNGRVNIKVKSEKLTALALRIPEWAKEYSFSRSDYEVKKGYALFLIDGEAEITADFKMTVTLTESDSRVKENVGKAAVTRGPLVYCLEEVDNGKFLDCVKVLKSGSFKYEDEAIEADAVRDSDNGQEKIKLRFIPYFKWANRGEGEMAVFNYII